MHYWVDGSKMGWLPYKKQNNEVRIPQKCIYQMKDFEIAISDERWQQVSMNLSKSLNRTYLSNNEENIFLYVCMAMGIITIDNRLCVSDKGVIPLLDEYYFTSKFLMWLLNVYIDCREYTKTNSSLDEETKTWALKQLNETIIVLETKLGEYEDRNSTDRFLL